MLQERGLHEMAFDYNCRTSGDGHIAVLGIWLAATDLAYGALNLSEHESARSLFCEGSLCFLYELRSIFLVGQEEVDPTEGVSKDQNKIPI